MDQIAAATTIFTSSSVITGTGQNQVSTNAASISAQAGLALSLKSTSSHLLARGASFESESE
jgi:hypothetical protein